MFCLPFYRVNELVASELINHSVVDDILMCLTGPLLESFDALGRCLSLLPSESRERQLKRLNVFHQLPHLCTLHLQKATPRCGISHLLEKPPSSPSILSFEYATLSSEASGFTVHKGCSDTHSKVSHSCLTSTNVSKFLMRQVGRLSRSTIEMDQGMFVSVENEQKGSRSC